MKNVKDIYALSPMQEVMLLHTASRRIDDVLFNQFRYEINGELDTAAFECAWRKLVERHDILRTAFLWEDLKSPVQVVREKAELPFELLDWRSEPESDRQALLQEFCDADRQRGFDPRKAPLMRIALIRCTDDAYYFVWSSHHLLLDRWCLQIVFDDLFKLYQSARSGTDPDWNDAGQFREYIDWIKQQDALQAEKFWRTSLAGYSETNPLTKIVAETEGDSQSIRLRDELHRDIRTLATSCGVTLSVLMQGAWSITLNRLLGKQDVVFGAVVSGRPAELEGVESIIGSFVNNVPVRAQLPRDASLHDWVKSLQKTQHQRSAFEYVAPTSIQRWSGLPVGEPMFDTLIVTLGSTGVAENMDFELTPLAGNVTTAYPLTLSIDQSGTDLSIHATRQPGRQCVTPLAGLLETYEATLRDVANLSIDAKIGSLPGFSGSLTVADLQATTPQPVVASTVKPLPVENQAAREEPSIDDMQDVLRNEWQLALGIDEIGPQDDFFKLGGSSLQAATLHARVESITRKSLPILTLFQATTLRGMAGTLAADSWPLRSDLAIGLRTSGSLEPLFCVASPEVNTVGYALLAKYQDEDRPIYVLQAPPDDKSMRRLSPREIPGTATTYVRELRNIQPHGPYYLLGMCTGSQIVLEMARQLDEDGAQPVFAGIINTWAHYTVSRLYHLQRLLHTGRWYGERLNELWQLGLKEQYAELRRVLKGRLSALMSRPAHDSEMADTPANVAPPSKAVEEQDNSDPWIEEFGWVHNAPQVEKYPGTLTVFRIRRQQFWRTREADLGWGKHAHHVRVERLPGKTHEGVLREPHVQIIGKRIAEQIKEAKNKDAK